MNRLQTFGLALVLTWGTACGSTQSVPPTESPDKSAQTGETDHKNTLKWSTASEVDNFGFDIYRAGSENGPFIRLNDSPIPGAGTSDLPTYYEYVDDTINPTLEYFYYIESISISGEREKFTPTNRVAPKIDPTKSDDEQ